MIEKDSDKHRQFTRRAILIGAGQAGLLAVLGGRLAWLQVVEGEKYKTLSDKNRIDIDFLAPSRGRVFDRNGEILARNEADYQVLVIPEKAEDLQELLDDISLIVPIAEHEMTAIKKAAKRQARFTPLAVQNGLTWEQMAKIEVNLPDLSGAFINVGEQRHYLHSKETAHILGYVGAVNKQELKQNDPLLRLPNFKIGKTGLEKFYDQSLRGEAGVKEVEVNVTGRTVRELSQKKPASGTDLHLSIDIELQKNIQNRLNHAESAASVLMDAQTGAIYALNSAPTFDSSDFVNGLSPYDWEELLNNRGLPLINKNISGQYPPGSTFKMITAMAALEEKIINQNTIINCPGHYDLGRDRFHCWKKTGHGNMNLTAALAESCDTYFYDTSKDVGIDKIAIMARRFGFGDITGIDLPDEKNGLMPDKAWKRGTIGNRWQAGETLIASIGQGYVQATPLQMAVMTARLVNGGKAVRPWIAYESDNAALAREGWDSMEVDQTALKQIEKGMRAAVNSVQGTAKKSRIDAPFWSMGGKTGTSQVRRITSRQREEGVINEGVPWKYRDHALFVGYAPLDKPRYVCAVVVEHAGSGSAHAAPIAKDILLMAQKRKPHRKDIKTDAV